MAARRPRVLLAITVYNGRAFVPRCLRSAKHLDTQTADIDVLVLDDASPEPGFSEDLKRLCAELGVFYYLTPRNLGIVRNVNLGLLAAVEKNYDYVIISNSDVIYSKQTVDLMLAAQRSGPMIGSVTAWSNNVSIYSIPNTDPDAHLAEQGVVDWLSASLEAHFRGTAIDIPAGISFCVLIPSSVVRAVGLMDPVYGRGYCEETDWTLRSLAQGFRATLAPAAFVYHQGRGSTLAAGLVAGGHSTVPANEAIIDFRYPLFREQVDAFVQGGILQRLHREGREILLWQAARQFGYRIDYRSLSGPEASDDGKVICRVRADGLSLVASFKGFELEFAPADGRPVDAARDLFLAGPGMGTVRNEPAAISFPEASQRPMYPVRV